MAKEKVVYESEEKKARYVMIRADKTCPARINNLSCNESKRMLSCRCGIDNNIYGDTKEDLIKKIATAIKRVNVKVQQGEIIYISEIGLAKEIIKYLGVK